MGVIEELYEPLTTLAFVAGATERIRLGVSVYVMPYRNPVVTAKTVATLDALSGGRVIFGVGVGWLREEFAALGQDPRSRGRTTDEYLEVCRRLWRDDLAHAGRDPAGFTVSVRTGILVREEGGGEERPLQETLGKIRRDASAYAAAGVGYLVVNLLHSRSIEALENALDAAADALNS
jgi:alkanesulfonate monooxygenase SsuD/methylene tetrahydromethanopterin reductase-like flavin-dependent oxidoreductase (luciferase family)